MPTGVVLVVTVLLLVYVVSERGRRHVDESQIGMPTGVVLFVAILVTKAYLRLS